MGIDVDRIEFNDNDFKLFRKKLEFQLGRLKEILSDPEFGQCPASIGAELELYIIDQSGRPLPINEAIITTARDPLVTHELNRYNLEYNFKPCKVSCSPFLTLEKAVVDELSFLNKVAETLHGRLVSIGILPTLRKSDFHPDCMTQCKRYQALLRQLLVQTTSQFKIQIDGPEPFTCEHPDITLEGANTSFQIHYQVKPQHYVDTYNAVQLLTPLVVALGANSPTLFGHRLWAETRIPLFKQSIDNRQIDDCAYNQSARVSFGHGWLRQSAYELFKESVNLYPPLMPITADENNNNGDALAELRLHQGTVWLWNRPVYDDSAGGHLRIEMRALPSGPTSIDMFANAAFIIGIAEGFRDDINELLPAVPFKTAEYNFFRSAQFGLQAELIWPDIKTGQQRKPIVTIIEDCLPIAQRGLEKIGIQTNEINRYLTVIENRLRTQQNGSDWQIKTLRFFSQKYTREQALERMLEIFIQNSRSNTPVAEWPIPSRQY